MCCRIVEMRNKDVIDVINGEMLGRVSDVEINTCDACLEAIVIYGRPKLLGLLGREDDCVIPWKNIELIGEDAILVRCPERRAQKRRCGFIESLLGCPQ